MKSPSITSTNVKHVAFDVHAESLFVVYLDSVRGNWDQGWR
jgi:hypothetical protein